MSNKNQLIYEKLGLHTEYVNYNLYSISYGQNKGSDEWQTFYQAVIYPLNNILVV